MKVALLAAAAIALLPEVADAQALRCVPPGALPRVRPDLPSVREPKRLLPIGGYTLAISWSPEHCRDHADDASARFQCGGTNRFGFVLHGLWPDGRGKDWPQYCRPARLVSPTVIRRNLCATPSPQLIQHEWAKHGTCMPRETPARYFARSSALYERLRYPDMDALSREPLTAGGLAMAMARANAGLTADMMRITATKAGWLDEVWLCLDTRFRYRRCPAHQGGLPAGTPIKIWRGRR